jgi:hypothetical protein
LGNRRKDKNRLAFSEKQRNKKQPVKDVFAHCLPMAKEDNQGRMSWDQTAVLVGIAGYNLTIPVKSGTIQVAEDGSNTWKAKGKNHQYLVEARPPSEEEKIINELMMHEP